jgi:hypothetical protein
VSIFVLVIFCETVVAIGDANNAKLIAIIGLSLFVGFFIINFAIIFVNFSSIGRVSKGIRKETDAKRYDAAIEYLKKLTQKKQLYLSNQMILFQLGYLEMVQDNIEDAQYYFEEYNRSKITNLTVYAISSIIPLLNVIYINNNDTAKLEEIKRYYKRHKAELLKLTKRNPETPILFNLVECINEGRLSDIDVTQFKNSRYYKIPLLRRIIEKEAQVQDSNS